MRVYDRFWNCSSILITNKESSHYEYAILYSLELRCILSQSSRRVEEVALEHICVVNARENLWFTFIEVISVSVVLSFTQVSHRGSSDSPRFQCPHSNNRGLLFIFWPVHITSLPFCSLKYSCSTR